MSEPFIGEIRMFAGTFAPRDWALCNGQMLPISSNETLFSVIGTVYGGDGRTTFGLPDLRGRVALHPGQGPGLSRVRIGQIGGAETTTLAQSNLPSHSHYGSLAIYNDVGDQDKWDADTKSLALPGANVRDALQPAGGSFSKSVPDSQVEGAITTANTGGGQAVSNMQPYLGVTYIIALYGLYPPRS